MSWPRKPPKGQPCDAHVGSGVDACGDPVVYRCRNIAVESCQYATVNLPGELWLCEPCAESMAARGVVARNPRLHKQIEGPA